MPPYMNANVPNEMQEVTKMKNARWLGRNWIIDVVWPIIG
jgi:hypothetical protein